MIKKISISTIFTGGLILLAGGYLLFSIFKSVNVDLTNLIVLNTVFTSILMQAFPFMLIGVLVSSAMHVFVPDEWIVKIFPTKYGIGFLTAMFAGALFPVCECAIVPVMSRLVKKGVPVPIAITFMLSAPIINPIVIMSTLYAFPGQPEITLFRVGFGLIIALAVGLIMMLYRNDFSTISTDYDYQCHNDHNSSINHSCTCHHHSHNHYNNSILMKFRTMFLHAGDEFFNVGKYLVIGALTTSLIQILIPKKVFVELGSKSGFSLILMMLMAFLFSACSTSDAFIARSFINKFSMSSILGFLVFGPMMDVKNLLMLLANFKKSFVIRLVLLITILNFLFISFFTIIFL
ncbi:permease [Vallitalea maricola]|uniref:Permease n=1 Tax=Vallitalea maricola TaxID=3074433 RepID=A0ACB5UNH8_9FIRM|nr:permease [Vallitalea sp. AN17-2]